MPLTQHKPQEPAPALRETSIAPVQSANSATHRAPRQALSAGADRGFTPVSEAIHGVTVPFTGNGIATNLNSSE